MFKRVFHEDWATIVPIISFCLLSLVFVVATIRALRMNKQNRDHLASLPLDDGKPKPPNSDSSQP